MIRKKHLLINMCKQNEMGLGLPSLGCAKIASIYKSSDGACKQCPSIWCKDVSKTGLGGGGQLYKFSRVLDQHNVSTTVWEQAEKLSFLPHFQHFTSKSCKTCKNIKGIFWLLFGMCRNQTLVKIYNRLAKLPTFIFDLLLEYHFGEIQIVPLA